jgi:hypothetical protein
MEEVFHAALIFLLVLSELREIVRKLTKLLRFWVNRNKVELMSLANNPKMKTNPILKLKNKV